MSTSAYVSQFLKMSSFDISTLNRGNETEGRVNALSVAARLDDGSANSDQKVLLSIFI